MPTRTMALPSVNQDHSDGAAALAGRDKLLAACATPMAPGAPAPPLRTGDGGADTTSDGVPAIGATASSGTGVSPRATPAAGALLPAVAAGSGAGDRASSASSAATRCSNATMRLEFAGSPASGDLRRTSPMTRPTAAPAMKPLKPCRYAPISAPSRKPIQGIACSCLAPIAAQRQDLFLQRFRSRQLGRERRPRDQRNAGE